MLVEKQSQFLDCGLGRDLRRDACPATCRPGPARANRAKQTQSQPRWWSEYLHHSAIPAFQYSSPMSIAQNKPNFGRTVGTRGLSCKTKPIRPCTGWQGRAKRSQFSGRRGSHHSIIPSFQYSKPRPFGQTKPIWGGGLMITNRHLFCVAARCFAVLSMTNGGWTATRRSRTQFDRGGTIRLTGGGRQLSWWTWSMDWLAGFCSRWAHAKDCRCSRLARVSESVLRRLGLHQRPPGALEL